MAKHNFLRLLEKKAGKLPFFSATHKITSVSREANISRLPFIFVNLSGISILLNHVTSQGVFKKDT